MILKKRGQGLSVNAIILMILGVFVLAMLIIGFTIGYGTLKDKLIPSNNVKTIADACSVACTTQSVYDFCVSPRELKASGVELKEVTCNYLAKQQTKYGISSCGSVSCDSTTRLLPENDFIYGVFENQAALDNDVGANKEGGTCTDEKNKGKTVYVLNKDKDTLLSVDCKAKEKIEDEATE